MSKKFKISLSIGIIAFLILAIVFYFTDLNISKAIASSDPVFLGVLLAAIGEFPIYLGPIIFGLVYGLNSKNKYVSIASHCIGLIGTYVFFFRMTKGIYKYFYSSVLGPLQYFLLAIVAVLVYILLVMLFNKIGKEKLLLIKDLAFIYLIVSISSFVLVTGLKLLWGRQRFRTLDSNYSGYTNFLTINGFNKGFKGDDYRSFPSGHTNSASSILVLGLIGYRLFKHKWSKWLSIGISIAYILVLAISRIYMGAHYASDVLFGFGISCVCLLITYIIFKKKGWLYVRGN